MNARGIPDTVLIRVCELYLAGNPRATATTIARQVSEETGIAINREHVYPLLTEARRRGYLSLLPASDHTLAAEIAKQYGHAAETIHVCSVVGKSTCDFVADAAAEFAVTLIKQRAGSTDRVGIGLSGGWTMMKVARNLAMRLRSEPDVPALGLHILSSGFDVENPSTAPVTFLGYFADLPTKIDSVALFTTPVVDAETYERAKKERGFEKALKRKDEIDIVLTSLAWAEDEHGALIDLAQIDDAAVRTLESLRRNGWVGDVGYLPYSDSAPLRMTGKRAVSLFDLDELIRDVRAERRHVVLVAGPCPQCDRLRDRALLPLLANSDLKVWSHVFIDYRTAHAVRRTNTH